MTGQSNSSQGRGHDRLPNWNPKNGGMLISQPVTSCLTNHSELCMSRLINNQSRRISIYRLQRWPSLGFESSVSSTLMTSDDPVSSTISVSVCPFTYLKNHMSEFTKFSVHVTCGRGSVLLWRQCNMSCTSGLWMTSCFHIMAWSYTTYGKLFTVTRQVARLWVSAPGAKFAIIDCLVCSEMTLKVTHGHRKRHNSLCHISLPISDL